MWRILKRLILAVMVIGAAIGGFVAVDQGFVPMRGELRNGALAVGIGLMLGLGVARWRRIDWGLFSIRLRTWSIKFIDIAAWAALAGASVVVIFLY